MADVWGIRDDAEFKCMKIYSPDERKVNACIAGVSYLSIQYNKMKEWYPNELPQFKLRQARKYAEIDCNSVYSHDERLISACKEGVHIMYSRLKHMRW